MSWQTLLVDREDGLVRLRLNRPDKRNAQSLEMWDELRRVGVELEGDDSVRVVVLSGEGPVFSAGIDLSVMRSWGARAIAGQGPGGSGPELSAELVQRAFSWLRDAPFATVALVQGAAIGAGCQLALACDLRILADDVVMALPEITFGIFPDLGGCAWLPEMVGAAKAKELAFLGERFDAAEALRLGIANRVVPKDQLQAEGLRLARAVAARAPLGIRAIKRAMAAAAESADAALRVSADEVRHCLASEDFKEAARALAEQRAPVFRGR